MKSVSVKKRRGHRTSKIAKSNQSYSNVIAMAICPIIVHFSTKRARSMYDVAWRGMWICVRSKDAQKQLARTSLRPKV